MLSILRRSAYQSRACMQMHKMSNKRYSTSSMHIALENIISCTESPAIELKTFEFCKQYLLLPKEEKLQVLRIIAQKYDFNKEAVKKAAESYLSQEVNGIGVCLKAADRLRSSLNPIYTNAFTRIRKLDTGVKFLVCMREDLLNFLPTLDPSDSATPHLKYLNSYLKEILSFSFNVGFLTLERITWDSSCDMLQKISEYEAVHPVRNWTDLKQRVGPYRRCYVFTHSSMRKEPIVVLHTALTDEISSDIMSIVKQNRLHSESDATSSKTVNDVVEDPKKIQAAVFYSITSSQKGLHGIELGNQLIKKVVREVIQEFPHITKFSSLSPIPGFRNWLLIEMRKIINGDSVISAFFSEQDLCKIKEVLCSDVSSNVWSSLSLSIASNRWINDPQLSNLLKNPLMRTCAHYLYYEKRRANALNSVAHFHLRNGAVLWRLNWGADLSPRGLENSCTMMVNYRYYIEETEVKSKSYVEDHCIKVSDEFNKLLLPTTKSSL